jgi:GTPase SAR1 family protein
MEARTEDFTQEKKLEKQSKQKIGFSRTNKLLFSIIGTRGVGKTTFGLQAFCDRSGDGNYPALPKPYILGCNLYLANSHLWVCDDGYRPNGYLLSTKATILLYDPTDKNCLIYTNEILQEMSSNTRRKYNIIFLVGTREDQADKHQVTHDQVLQFAKEKNLEARFICMLPNEVNGEARDVAEELIKKCFTQKQEKRTPSLEVAFQRYKLLCNAGITKTNKVQNVQGLHIPREVLGYIALQSIQEFFYTKPFLVPETTNRFQKKTLKIEYNNKPFAEKFEQKTKPLTDMASATQESLSKKYSAAKKSVSNPFK